MENVENIKDETGELPINQPLEKKSKIWISCLMNLVKTKRSVVSEFSFGHSVDQNCKISKNLSSALKLLSVKKFLQTKSF